MEVEIKPSRLSRFKGWMRRNRKPLLLTFLLVLSFLGGGVYSFLAYHYRLPLISPLASLSGEPAIALAAPTVLDQPHPISGVFYSEQQEKIWSKRRPLAVMIDNHALARPYQFGLQQADLIWEAVAEGGITRFLAIFHGNNVAKLGAVRSSRVYYIDWALEFPAYYSHVGGAGTL
nr:DUF3048 domain-containing protein [Candidatus Saccharibacteria bacterium]